MARRTNYGFDKRQKEKQRMEKQEKKRLARQERKELKETGEITVDDTMVIAPVDPSDLGLDDDKDAADTKDAKDTDDSKGTE